MNTCEDCKIKGCTFRGKFESNLVLAKSELENIHVRQELLSPDKFWEEITFFCAKHPRCVLDALNKMMMESHLSDRAIQYRKNHKDIF